MELYKQYNGHLVTLYHGDTLNILHNIPDATIDLIFIDPPYNIGKQFGTFVDKWDSDEEYLEWCYQWLALCIEKLKPTGSLYFMSSTQYMPFFDIFLRKQLTILSRIVWSYDSSGVQAKRYYGSLYEPILFCVKNPQHYTFNAEAIQVEAKTGAIRKLVDYRKPIPAVYNSTKVPGNVWEFPRVRYRMPEYENHPSQKPEALLERIIKASSQIGDTILDPFAGSFTTCAVAQRLERVSIGIEREEEYIKTGLRRLNIATEYDGETLKPIQKTYHRESPNKQQIF
jgi:adenine-specific DNA-methyltransferase